MDTLMLKGGVKATYRQLKEGDQGKLKAFLKAFSEKAQGFFTPHAHDNDTIDQVISRSMDDKDRVYIVLDENNNVVAYFFLWWYSSEFPVLGIGIADQYQGMGLGRILIEILIKDAQVGHCRAIELTTVVSNKRAFSLYQNLGFQYLGKVDNLVGDGSIVEESHMYFPIEPGIKIPQREHITPF